MSTPHSRSELEPLGLQQLYLQLSACVVQKAGWQVAPAVLTTLMVWELNLSTSYRLFTTLTVLLQQELYDATGALVALLPQGGVHHGEVQGPSHCQGCPLLGDMVPCRQVCVEVVLPVEEGCHVDVAPQGHAGQHTSRHPSINQL